MKTLVITSINPKAQLDYQKACFNKWKKLGYIVKTLNCKKEKESLLKCGFDANDVVELAIEETAFQLYGKAVPRILPVMNRAVAHGAGATIFVNSDIYPAQQKNSSNYLASIADTIALTRSECIELRDNRYTDSTPYRGGLDIFFFTKKGLQNVFKSISTIPIAEHMAFGVPGWDFFLAHELFYMHKGKIMDGEIFLHKTHKTTYNMINTFELFAEQMHKSGYYQSAQTTELASEFATIISCQCIMNKTSSRLLKRMYYSKPDKLDSPPPKYASIINIESKFKKILANYNIDNSYDVTRIRNIIRAQLDGASWIEAESYRDNYFNRLPFTNGYLFLVLLQLIIKSYCGNHQLTYKYPKNSLHGIAVQEIMANTSGKEELRYIIKLFANELIDHSIFNLNLFKYIALSATNSISLGLCSAIYSQCRKELTENV